MEKQVKAGETSDCEDCKRNPKAKRGRKKRKSGPVVDVTSLLLSGPKSPVRKTKDGTRKRNSKPFSRNSSSSSLDGFVVRTAVETKEKGRSETKENRSDKFERKENAEGRTKTKGNGKQKTARNKTKVLDGFEAKMASTPPQEKRDAFQFMMDSRHKSIGTNSPGRELKINDSLPKDKEKLSARRSMLENWAEKKGGIKRKNEDIERDECIAVKMDERAKRLKKLLNVSNGSEEKKKTIKIDSDTDNSQDSCVEDRNIRRKSRNLDGFLRIPEKHDEDDCLRVYDSDKEANPREVIKIKMFSPQVFKRTRHKLKTPEGNVPENKPAQSKKSKHKKNKNDVRVLCSENSDTSNDSDTFVPRRSTRKKRPPAKLLALSETDDSRDSVIVVEDDKAAKSKRPPKMAPVFLLSAPKPKPDPEALEAKKKFLNSGIPDALKKVIEKEKAYEVDVDVFPKISHVQQRTPYGEDSVDCWNLPNVDLDLKYRDDDDAALPNVKKLQKGSVTNLVECPANIKPTALKKPVNTESFLQRIKKENPEYPVNRCFRALNRKAKIFERRAGKRVRRKSTERLPNRYEMWTEKYKATSSHEVIVGNNKQLLELKRWLEKWLDYVRDVQSKTNNIKKFYDSDSEFDIDGNSRDSNPQGLCNATIVAGPHGCGKTMSVYALCNELGINIIELNASSKRTGKRLLQELQEATQSHQVRKNESMSSFLDAKNERTDRKLCLLLIEDLDIVFEQDDGLLSALNQLLTTTKRPIVITTTDTNSNYLKKFVSQYPVIKFSALSSTFLSVWLQILCLIEGIVTNVRHLGDLLEFHNGDVRRTLLHLQYIVQTSTNLYTGTKEETSSNKNRIDEESNMLSNGIKGCIYNFVDRNCLVRDFSLEKIWWNFPSIVCTTENILEKYENVTDSLELIDIVYTKSNIFERHGNTIHNQSYLKDSMELNEKKDSYSSTEFIRNWADTLLINSVDSYLEIGNFRLDRPDFSQKRWVEKQRKCGEKFSELVPFSYHTERRNYVLDYFPTLRAISRSETHRASVNVKRKNRFYNYFRAFDFQCSDSTNETACNIFSLKSKEE